MIIILSIGTANSIKLSEYVQNNLNVLHFSQKVQNAF